jgi:hypothetical protein
MVLISERAREKQRDINQKIREVEREVGEVKRAIEKEKEIRWQARERRQQALSALTEQEMQEANWQARERLLHPETLEDFRLQVREMIQKVRSSLDQYPTPNQFIPSTLYPCCPDCGSASTSASRLPTTFPETPRLPSGSQFANIQQRRPAHPFPPSEITPSSFCRCRVCLRPQDMITKPSNSQKDKAYLRRKLNIPQPEEEEVEAETPTCSGAVNEEEDVWEKYVRDDPKAKKAASKKESPAKRDRYPKRVHIVSQDEGEGESRKYASTVVEDEETGEGEEGERVIDESVEKVVVELKEGKESEEEKKSDLEEETEDQDQVGDDKLSTCSSEAFITLISGEDAN